jgi:Cof subfamily protein (haloacid dehalogenase superfamily)
MECLVNSIQAVFLDIDGTIVYDSEVMKSAVNAIQKLQDRGMKIALCTGRSILHTVRVQEQLGIDCAVYFNGGLTMQREEIHQSHPLTKDVVRRILSFSDSNQLPCILHTVYKTVAFEPMPSKVDPLLRAFDFPPVTIEDRETWLQEHADVYQVNVFMDRRWEQVVQNEIPECLIYRWDESAVDLQKRGCDKSMGGLALLKSWNISPEHAMHIGDGGNDIGMFRTMGMSVAMGNAPEEVQQYAKATTDRVENDGVYKALEKLNLL